MLRKITCFLLILWTTFAIITLEQPKRVSLSVVISPNYTTGVNYMGKINLGLVAPGQTITLVFNRESGDVFDWLHIDVTETNWLTEIERDPEYLTARIKVPRNASGKGSFRIVMSNPEIRATETADFDVVIDTAIFTANATVAKSKIAAGDTTTVTVTIKSNSAAPEIVDIGEVFGFPSEWSEKKTIYLKPYSTTTISFRVTPAQEGYYHLAVKPYMRSSRLSISAPFKLWVTPTLRSKFIAFGDGFNIIPIILQPFYSILSWLGLL